MGERPLVSVVTATWGRPQTVLEAAIPSVAAQTYQPLQHIIVTDGFDERLNALLREAGYDEKTPRRLLVQLGRNWTQFMGDGAQGAAPRLVGSFLAAGDYLCYLDDDNEFLPHHVATLAAALDAGADLACCRTCLTASRDHARFVAERPGREAADTNLFMHRAELLRSSTWGFDGYCGDAELVERWVTGGCRWVWVEEPTVVMHPCRLGAPDGWVAVRVPEGS